MARILVIEDSELMRLTLRRVLEALGHEVMEAVNGVDGIQLQSEHNFDLVVTDIIMPEKGGDETIIELKENSLICELSPYPRRPTSGFPDPKSSPSVGRRRSRCKTIYGRGYPACRQRLPGQLTRANK